MTKLQTANRVMEDLIDMAMSDAKMSEDEKEILFSINSNLAVYAKTIMESIGDGSISEMETKQIKEMEDKIMHDAKKIARADDNITVEEKNLLDQLIDAIQSISKMA